MYFLTAIIYTQLKGFNKKTGTLRTVFNIAANNNEVI